MVNRILKHERMKTFIVILSISILITIIIGAKVVFSSGYVLMAEQFEVYSLDSFIKVFFPLWNDNTQSFNLADIAKMYLYGLFSLVIRLLGLSYKELQRVMLLAPHSIAFISMYYFAQCALSQDMEADKVTFLSLPSISAALVYTINPWIAFHPRNLILRFEYAFLPLILILFIRILDEKKKQTRDILLLSTILAIVAGYRFVVLLIPALTLYILISLFHANSRLHWLKYALKQLLYAGTLFILLSAAKHLPALLYSFRLGVGGIVQFTQDMIKGFPILEVLSMRVCSHAFNATYADSASYLFLIVTIFSLAFLSMKRGKSTRVARFSFLLFLVYVPLSVLEYGIFADVLLSGLMTLESYGRLFRHGHWNSLFVLLAVSLMTGLSIFEMRKRSTKLEKVIAPLVVVILAISSISAWPLLTGDMNGYWRKSEIPEDYIWANGFLANQSSDFHVLWFPPFGGRKAIWDNSKGVYLASSPTGIFAVRSSAKPSYDTPAFYFFDYFNPIGPRQYYRPMVGYQGKNVGKIYSNINVQYVVVHYDGLWTSQLTNDKLKQICNELEQSPFVERIYTGEYLSLFELSPLKSTISTTSPFLIVGGVSAYGSIVDSCITRESGFSPIFIEGVRSDELRKLIDNTSMVLINKNDALTSLLFSAMESGKVRTIKPSGATNVFEPDTTWSVTSTDSTEFQFLLARLNLRNWDWGFDYNEGIVVTAAGAKIEDYTEPSQEDLMVEWDFGSDEQTSSWTSSHPKQQRIFMDQASLKAELYNSTSGQKQIESPLIRVSSSGAYIIEYKIQGENVENLYASVTELDEHRHTVESQLFDIREPSSSFDWIHVNQSFVVSNPKTEFIQLRIEHGHETAYPLPNKIWLDDIRIYDVSDRIERNNLEMSFTTAASDNQDLFVRFFRNQAGGMIRIYVDNKVVAELDTKDQLNQFCWEKIGALGLTTGKHTITLENANGFNAVNLFALTSSEEYAKAEKWVHESLKDKALVYLFEGESGLYRENATVSDKYLAEASNGGIVELQSNCTLWQEIYSPSNRTYRLALRGNGTFHINITNQTLTMSTPLEENTTSLSWAYSTPIPLRNGTHKLHIQTPSSGDLDAIWLYTVTRPNETLEDVFKKDEKLAEVISYEKIDSTYYKVQVNATEPFVLYFAKAYDPLWIAHVNGERIESIPLYSLINGFWIDQTGELEIVIEFEPQKWFYYGSIVSITTFLACAAYLTYGWTRSKAIWKRIRTVLDTVTGHRQVQNPNA